MYIEKEKWEKLKEIFCDLSWEQDRLSKDGSYLFRQLNNLINNIDRTKSNKIYVITNNAIFDDEIDYQIKGVAFTKDDANKVELKTLKCICDAVSIPVAAIGGITKENILQLSGSGVDGVAVVSAIFAQKDKSKAAFDLLNLSRKMVKGK